VTQCGKGSVRRRSQPPDSGRHPILFAYLQFNVEVSILSTTANTLVFLKSMRQMKLLIESDGSITLRSNFANVARGYYYRQQGFYL
jgi:hypothetical protein